MKKSIYTVDQIDALLSGKGLAILGRYDSTDEITDPVEGGHYYIGTEEPYDVYTYVNGAWVNAGPLAIEGPPGPQGPAFTYDDFTPEQLAALRGKDGKSPYINASTNNWMVWDEGKGSFVDTGVNAVGKAPSIGKNGNWFIDGEDTGVPATNAQLVAEAKGYAVATAKIAAEVETRAEETKTAAGNAQTAAEEAFASKKLAEAAADRAEAAGGNSSGITNTESGESISVTDSDDAPLRGFRLFGKTMQDEFGANLFDGVLEHGMIDPESGQPVESEYAVRSANFVPVVGGSTILISCSKQYSNSVFEYDENKVFVRTSDSDHFSFYTQRVHLDGVTRYIKFCSDEMSGENDLTTKYVVAYETEENIFDSELERGGIDKETGAPDIYNDYDARSADFVHVEGGSSVFVYVGYDATLFEYDENKTFLKESFVDGRIITLQSETRYIKIWIYDIVDVIDLTTEVKVARVIGGVVSPNNPIYPENAGYKGNINVQINDQTFVIHTPNGLPGIPDNTNGNYTDSNGQKWYCDEIDFERGVYIQRVKKKVFDGTENTIDSGLMGSYAYDVPDIMLQSEDEVAKVICSHLKPISHVDALRESVGGISVGVDDYGYRGVWLCDTNEFLNREFLAAQYSAGTPVTVWYRPTEPIETPLTAEQLSVFAQMHSYDPATTITNDANAGMEVKYVANITKYIDSKLAAFKSEVWTFTLTDGTTVKKEMVVK